MATNKEPVHIKLTPAQKQAVRKATGKEASALELTAEELEERIAPARLPGRRGGRTGRLL